MEKTVHLGFLKKQPKKGVFSRQGEWRGLVFTSDAALLP